MMKLKLTRNDADEVMHKLQVLADESDLQEDYGISQEQADTLVASVPRRGGEWEVPDWAEEAVKGEMQDHVKILRVCADGARSAGLDGQALGIDKQAVRFERVFE